MDKHMKWFLIALCVLLVLFGINQFQQSERSSDSDQVFVIERDEVFNIKVSNGTESISLFFNGESWFIDGNDTLVVKKNAVDSFFNKVLNVKKTTLVSKNKSKWDKFNVGDSTGTQLVLNDHNGKSLGQIAVGRSGAEWSVSNIRIGDEIEVYQTNENIIYQLNTSPTYWGEVPPPLEPDSTRTDSL
jgi:hypothetical protein